VPKPASTPSPLPGASDFLAARMHGRRTRMIDDDRFDAACRLPTTSTLARSRFPSLDHPESTTDAPTLQRHALTDWLTEIHEFCRLLPPAAAAVLQWQAARLDLELAKYLLRAAQPGPFHPPPPPPGLEGLPINPAPTADNLANREALDRFRRRTSSPALARFLSLGLTSAPDPPDPFLFEAALDRAYFLDGLQLTRAAPRSEREHIARLIHQEIEGFHLQLAARGRFIHDLPAPRLLELRIPATFLGRSRLRTMMARPDVTSAATLAVGHAIDALPAATDAGALDQAARQRLARIARRVIRERMTGLAALFAYVTLRELECQGLITLAEALRLGRSGSSLAARLPLARHA